MGNKLKFVKVSRDQYGKMVNRQQADLDTFYFVSDDFATVNPTKGDICNVMLGYAPVITFK